MCVEQLILGHAYNEYLVLALKTGYDILLDPIICWCRKQ
jgi:hypothetical protein